MSTSSSSSVSSSLSTRAMSSSSSSLSSLSSSSSLSSESSSSSSEVKGTILSFAVEGVVWNKSKFISSEIAAVSSDAVGNRLAQTVGVNTASYKVGSVSLFLRERQGESDEDFDVLVGIYEADINGNPVDSIITTTKKSSEITWTGWHTFDFVMEERDIPNSKLISVVMWQDGGDEDNYVSWVYSKGSFPGAKALYSADGGTNWLEQDSAVRLVRVLKSYNPFSVLCSEGLLRSSVAEESIVTVDNFDEQTMDGGAVYEGEHKGTVTDDASSDSDDSESSVEPAVIIANKNLITSIVVDTSGSMGWNDRGKNKTVAVNEIVTQIKSKYPGQAVFDFVQFGAGGIGQPSSGGGSSYATIKLDPYNPTMVKNNHDGTAPSLTDGIIASGFSKLEAGHTYVLQSATSGNVSVFNGSGLIDQNLGIRTTENVQSVGSWLLPVRMSVQEEGTGAESGNGSSATVAEVPVTGSVQIRQPSISGRLLSISGITEDLFADRTRISVDNPSSFERGETVDCIDADGASCGYVISGIGQTFIDVTPATQTSFGASDTPLGGFVQQTSLYSPIYLDPNAMIELLVKDTAASRDIRFFVQTSKGGQMEWDFTAMKEWLVQYITYIDQPFNLVTYLTDEDGDPLPSHTRVKYYIDTLPRWKDLPVIKLVELDEAVTIEQGEDTISLPSVSGISIGDYATLIASDGKEYAGYVVSEIDEINLYVRILPPVLQEAFQLVSVKFETPPTTDRSDQKLDMIFTGVDISAMKADRLGQNRLASDPDQVDPSGTDPDAYNQDRTRWLNESFEIPIVASNADENIGYASVHIMPVTEDYLNTEQEEGEKAVSIFSQTTLTDEERAELDALEDEYDQMVEDHPEQVVDVSEDEKTPEYEDKDTVNDQWILSPTEVPIGEPTKFTTLSKTMSLYEITGESLRYDISSSDTHDEQGLLSKKHTVFPTVSIRDNNDNTLARYILEDYPVYFASPVQIFCQPEIGKTVNFEMCCADMQTGTKVDYIDIRAGVFAASGETIRLDYIVYHRGQYADGITMRVKIYDAFRTSEEVQSEPWLITPKLEAELGTTRPGCGRKCAAPINFSSQSFNKLERGSDSQYTPTIDDPSSYAEAVYLEGYTKGGFEVDVVNGRASFTVPAIDVVTRMIVKVEVVCPDNGSISCARTDSVWIKNPIKIVFSLPAKANGGIDVAPFEGRVHMTCFGEPVENNVPIFLEGSSHNKYNDGDSSKIDAETAQLIASRLKTNAIDPTYQILLDAITSKTNTWPATLVKPSISKTIGGTASGYMIGPHGSVVMHVIKSGESAGELEGDKEIFTARTTYRPPLSRGEFTLEDVAEIEWVEEDVVTDEEFTFIKVALWRDGEQTNYNQACYTDGWDKIIVVADAPATRNAEWSSFGSQWISDDLIGLTRIPNLARNVSFQCSGATITNIPGRNRRFYPTRPVDPDTGVNIGETDDQNSGFVGWSAVQISKCAELPPPKGECKSDCCYPPCSPVIVRGEYKNENLKMARLIGCPTEFEEACIIFGDDGYITYVNPTIIWTNPLDIKMWFNGKQADSDPYDFIRDGATSTEIWVEATFSGRPLPLIAREHDVRDPTGAPMPMPAAFLDLYYLDQEWDEFGSLVKSEKFRDGTLSLTNNTPYISVCRTTSSDGHYHSCEVDDVTGNGTTTGTFVENSITPMSEHVHIISDFVVNDQMGETGVVHSHQPLSVAIAHINPIVNNSLNICLAAKVSYDASRSPVARTKEYITCTQLEWFDFWEMTLSVPTIVAQQDVMTGDNGTSVTATIKHKVNGEYIAIDDGVRVAFNVNAYKPKTDESDNEDGVTTFDTNSNAVRIIAIVDVTATLFIDGKTITKKKTATCMSTLQWAPSVKGLVDEPTDDDVYIAEAISKTTEVMGSSSLYDAIVLAADRINIYQADNQEWKSADKLIFVLTDGCENLSQRTINQVSSRIKMLFNGDRRVYVALMLFGSPSQNDIALVNKIRSETGGAVVRIPIGYDPALIPALVSDMFTTGGNSFNHGSYSVIIDIGGGDTADAQGGKFKQSCVNIDLPTNAVSTFSVRFSTDGDIWTAWSERFNLTAPSTCISLSDSQYRYMQYTIYMNGNGDFESPRLHTITTSYMLPSTDIIFLQPIAIDKSFDEYVSETVMTHAATIPTGAEISYGVTDHNTTLAEDYASQAKPWFKANERSIMLTRMNEPAYPTGNKTYTALNGSWPSQSKVDVYVISQGETEGKLVSDNLYVLNSSAGKITFASPLAENSSVILDIKPDNVVRAAIRVINHSETPAEIGQITMTFNKTKRVRTDISGMIIRHPMGDDLDESSSSSSSVSP